MNWIREVGSSIFDPAQFWQHAGCSNLAITKALQNRIQHVYWQGTPSPTHYFDADRNLNVKTEDDLRLNTATQKIKGQKQSVCLLIPLN